MQVIQESEKEINNSQSGYYKKICRVNGVKRCFAIAMNKKGDILVCGSIFHIKVWKVNCDGLLKLTQKLKGHTKDISCLLFSKKDSWVISSSKDNTLIIWKQEQVEWICQQILDGHKNGITDTVLSDDEDQLISSSLDGKIRVWMKDDNKQWICKQTLLDHFTQVNFISLSFNLLVSLGTDKTILWEKQNCGFWRFQQTINRPSNGIYLRACFIEEDLLMATTFCKLRLLKLAKQCEVKFELLIDLSTDCDFEYFPLTYSKEQKIVVCRHGKETFVLKRQANEEFVIHQVFHGNYTGRYLTDDGKLLILTCNKNQQMEIFGQKNK